MDIAKERTAEEWKDTVRNKRHGPTRTRARTPLDRVTDPAVVLGVMNALGYRMVDTCDGMSCGSGTPRPHRRR